MNWCRFFFNIFNNYFKIKSIYIKGRDLLDDIIFLLIIFIYYSKKVHIIQKMIQLVLNYIDLNFILTLFLFSFEINLQLSILLIIDLKYFLYFLSNLLILFNEKVRAYCTI